MDAGQGSGSMAAGRIVLAGRLWRRRPFAPAVSKPVHTSQTAEEHDCLLLDIDIRAINTEKYEQILRWAKEPAGEEQRQKPEEASLADESVLFNASISFPEGEGEEEIADFPVRHLILCEGQIARPAVARAVKRHVVSLGLDWKDAASHLPQLLADLPASAPLRNVILGAAGSVVPTDQEVKRLINALDQSRRVVGVYLSFATYKFADSLMWDDDIFSCLWRSKTYLAFDTISCRSIVIDDMITREALEQVFESTSKVKQLRLLIGSFSRNTFHPPAPSFSLTRVRFDIVFPGLLVKILPSLKSLTDVSLFIYGPEEMQTLLHSRLHTSILTLRLHLQRPSPEINQLIWQGLIDSSCTIQFLSCAFFKSRDVLLQMLDLLAGSEPPVGLAALRLQSDYESVGIEMIAGLCKYLCAPASRNLVHLDFHVPPNRRPDVQTAAEWELAKSLKNNFTLCHLDFIWKNDAPESCALKHLRRNKLYRAADLLVEEPVLPDLAKLFVCGHQEAGKTTMRRALLLCQPPFQRQILSALRPLFLWLKPAPDRTRGMEMQPLKFQGHDNKLMICDLAGDEEYHVFHHYFMNATRNDIFIVVCRHDDRAIQSEFNKRLQYWLRFIASHKRMLRKNSLNDQGAIEKEMGPKVIVVVNFFTTNWREEQMTSITSDWPSPLKVEFSEVVDFGENSQAASIFGVNAKTGFGVQQVYKRLESLIENFGNTAWPVPRLCYDISELITKGQARRNCLFTNCLTAGNGKSRLLTTFSAVYKAVKDNATRNNNATIEPMKIQAALEELHSQGYVIYFSSKDTSDDCGDSINRAEIIAPEGSPESTLVIIDTNWFSNKLIGSLFDPHRGYSGQGRFEWSKEDIKHLLRRKGCHERDLEAILQYLLNLELCVQLSSKPAVGEENFLLFPALHKETEIRFPARSTEESTTFFGRRKKCEDASRYLIPFAVFTRLQVKLHRAYSSNNNSLHHGYGWTSFMRGSVGVVVRFGGDAFKNEACESRQWVDILTFCPADSSPESSEGFLTGPMADPRFLDAEQVINEIRNHFDAACEGGGLGGIPTVKMEEMVLQNAKESSDASPLAHILGEVKAKGLLSINQEWKSVESTPMQKLLLPAEIEDCVKGKFEALQSIDEEYCVSSSEEGDGMNTEQLLHTGTSEDPIFNGSRTGDSLNDRRLIYICRGMRGLHSKVDNMEEILRTLKKDINQLTKVLQKEVERVITNCSTRLLRRELRKDSAYPSYPYLVNKEGKLTSAAALLLGKKKVRRIHFLCERQQGPHPVAGQKGMEVTLEWANWVRKVVRVMVPAVKILCCLARVAAAVSWPTVLAYIPTGGFLDTLLSGLGIREDALKEFMLANAIQALLAGVADADLKELKDYGPAEGEVREVVAAILGSVENVDMSALFGLTRVISEEEGRFYWVCKEHKSTMNEARRHP